MGRLVLGAVFAGPGLPGAVLAGAGAATDSPGFAPTDELQPRSDVAPLVRATHLELHAVGPVEVPEVGRLEEHVAELGVRQTALQPALDRVLGQHVRDREVLADVAQEL